MADPHALDLDRFIDLPAPAGRVPLPEDFQRDTDSDGLAAEPAYSPDLVAPDTAQADPAAPGDIDDDQAAPDNIDDDLIALDTSSSADDFDAYGFDPQPLPPADIDLPEDLPDDDIGEPGLDAVPVPDDLEAFGQGAADDDTDLGFDMQQHLSDATNASVIAGRIAGAGAGGGSGSGSDFGHGDTSGAETAPVTEHGLLDEVATGYSRPEPDSVHADPADPADTSDADGEPEAEIDAYESVDNLDDFDDFGS